MQMSFLYQSKNKETLTQVADQNKEWNLPVIQLFKVKQRTKQDDI